MVKKISLWVLVAGYVLAGVNHFVHPQFYVRIVPPFLPMALTLVYASGLVEIILGLLLIPKWSRRPAALMIALMLVVFLAVHVDMALHPVTERYQVSKAGAWLRLALQPLLILWVLVHAEVFHSRRPK